MIDFNELLEGAAEGMTEGFGWAVSICIGICLAVIGLLGVAGFFLLKWCGVI